MKPETPAEIIAAVAALDEADQRVFVSALGSIQGRTGGLTKTPARAAASRRNGKLGGGGWRHRSKLLSTPAGEKLGDD